MSGTVLSATDGVQGRLPLKYAAMAYLSFEIMVEKHPVQKDHCDHLFP